MTDGNYQIHEEVPTDEEGHPIHPERGHRICGARKSDRTTPTDHGRERDEYAYCLQSAGWGTDSDVGACRDHPYTGSQIGKANPNHSTGAYSEHLRSDLSDREQDAMDSLVGALEDDESSLDVVREMAAEAALKYKRSGDHRFLREFRQLVSEFNLAPNEDVHELTGEGGGGLDVTIRREVVDDVDD